MDEQLILSEALADAGYEDVLIIDLENARKVLTDRRLEVIQTIRDQDVSSIRELARTLDRKENVVYEDLQLLFEEGIVDFERDANRKVPVLRHDNALVRPITLRTNDTAAT